MCNYVMLQFIVKVFVRESFFVYLFFVNEPYHRYGYYVSVNMAPIYRTLFRVSFYFILLYCHFLCLRINCTSIVM